MLILLGILLVLLGLWFGYKYLAEREKQKEEKGFIVIGTTLLLLWLFPGSILFILGAALIIILMFGAL